MVVGTREQCPDYDSDWIPIDVPEDLYDQHLLIKNGTSITKRLAGDGEVGGFAVCSRSVRLICQQVRLNQMLIDCNSKC